MTITPPSFFVVGAPKCGTTALCDFLGQHPDIFVPEIKEPNFFGSDLTGAKYTDNIDKYHNLFKSGGKKISGEGSTWYLYSRNAAEEIYKYNSKAKIIVMLREPVELIYSLHNQLVFDGLNENLTDFYEAVGAEIDRRHGKRIPASCLRREALLYSTVPRFKDQLKRYLEIFGKENVLIILHDDFSENAIEVYKKVLQFLGQDSSFLPEVRSVNSSKFVRYRFVNTLKSNEYLKYIFKSLIPSSGLNLLKRFISRANTNHKKRPGIDKKFAREYQIIFNDDINYLSALLERDLSDWIKKYENDNSESVSGRSTKVRNYSYA